MKCLAMTMSALWVVGGCSTSPESVDTSGRHPSLGTTESMTAEAKDAEVDTGRLVVLTPRTPEEHRNADSTPIIQYSGYTVYTEDGHKVAHEENHGVHMLGPEERKLAPGRYFVRLDEEVSGRDFWVRVEKGRVTRVENGIWNDIPATVK